MIYNSLNSLRVNSDLKVSHIAKNLGLSNSRYYYLERQPQDLTVDRIIDISNMSGYSPVDVFKTICNQLDILEV